MTKEEFIDLGNRLKESIFTILVNSDKLKKEEKDYLRGDAMGKIASLLKDKGSDELPDDIEERIENLPSDLVNEYKSEIERAELIALRVSKKD